MAGPRESKLVELVYAPGVVTNTTDRGAKGRYKDSNRVRWHKGLPEKIAGWTRLTLASTVDVVVVPDPPVAASNLTAATGCSATAFGFVSNSGVVGYYPYCTEARGSFTGDLNTMLPSATQTLTLLVAQSLTTGVFSVFMRGTFPGTSPVQGVFTNVTFTDKNGVPRTLTSASATYTPVSPARAHWEWNLGVVTMEDAGEYLLEFHE